MIKKEEVTRAFEPVLKALHEKGVNLKDINELLTVRLPREAVEILLEMLPQVEHDWAQEFMVRGVCDAKYRYDGRVLANIFDTASSESLKWAIGNTIASTKPKNIDDWIVDTLSKDEHGNARRMLCIAAGRLVKEPRTNAVLMKIFEQMPGHAAQGLGLSGGAKELTFLKKKAEKDYMAWIRRSIQTAIRRIERRMEKQRKVSKPSPTAKR